MLHSWDFCCSVICHKEQQQVASVSAVEAFKVCQARRAVEAAYIFWNFFRCVIHSIHRVNFSKLHEPAI